MPKLKIEKLHLSLKFVYLGYFDKLKWETILEFCTIYNMAKHKVNIDHYIAKLILVEKQF
jgi:hypothetical protein